jgi:hypothetical protein
MFLNYLYLGLQKEISISQIPFTASEQSISGSVYPTEANCTMKVLTCVGNP